jgi:hypothetical protein
VKSYFIGWFSQCLSNLFSNWNIVFASTMWFHITRGNALKLVKHRSRRDIRKYGFTNRIVDLWNSLPNHIVEAKTMFQFENRLDRHWENHPMKYDFRTS